MDRVIYAPYVMETTVTFEYEVPGTETFAGRIEAIAAEYPYLVCEIDGRIAAYAYGHRHMERAAYQWNAELSVYVDQGQFRRGIGRALYQAVMEILKLLAQRKQRAAPRGHGFYKARPVPADGLQVWQVAGRSLV